MTAGCRAQARQPHQVPLRRGIEGDVAGATRHRREPVADRERRKGRKAQYNCAMQVGPRVQLGDQRGGRGNERSTMR